MTNSKIIIEVDEPKDLFAEPDLHLHSVHIGKEAALETLKNEMIKNPEVHEALVKIEKKTENDRVILDAMKTYCINKISLNKREIYLIGKAGRSNLLYASVVSVIVLLFVFILNLMADSLPFTVGFLTQALVIAFWVVFWNPIDLLAFERKPLRIDNQVYDLIIKKIGEGSIKIQ